MAGVAWWFEFFADEDGGVAAPVDTDGRSILIDNCKAFSMYFVIFGHMMQFAGNRAVASMDIVLFSVKMFQMPVFCFISGVCSQRPCDPRQVRVFLAMLVFPMLLWTHVVFPLLAVPLLMHLSPRLFWQGLVHPNWEELLQPTWQMAAVNRGGWYLFALSVWRGLTVFVFSNFQPWIVLIWTMFVSCSLGYLDDISDRGLMCTIGFMPYYVIGYVVPFKRITNRVAYPKPIGVLAALIFLVLFITWINNVCPTAFHTNSHQQLVDIPWHTRMDFKLLWVFRVTKVLMDMVVVGVLIFLVIPRNSTPFSWLGKHTLYAYLLHPAGIEWRLMFLSACGWTEANASSGAFSGILEYMVFTLAVLVFFSSAPCRWLFHFCLEPRWAEHFTHFVVKDALVNEGGSTLAAPRVVLK